MTDIFTVLHTVKMDFVQSFVSLVTGLMQIATESYDAENAAAAGDQFAFIVELSTGVESNSVVAWSSTPEMTSPFLGLLGNLWKPTRRQGHSEDPTQQ